MRIVSADVIITPHQEIQNGSVFIENGVITQISSHVHDGAEKFSGALLPGFVDIHCHGGGGYSFGKVEQIEDAAAFHRGHGTTTILASLVSTPIDEVTRILEETEDLVQRGVIAGVHLEGPFLSIDRCGAQNPSAIVDPEPHLVQAVLNAGKVTLRLITIAPERPNGIAAVKKFVENGVTVAVGHSEATAAVGSAAFDAGATVITHFGNGMRPYDHPDSSFGMSALEDKRVSTEIIADGVHVGLERLEMVRMRKGQRFIAVTDAIVAAGMPDGDWDLGGLAVTTTNNVAHLSGTQTLAGSTLTMDRAFNHLVEIGGFSLIEAAHATATEPARVLNLDEVGSIEVGKRADFVVWSNGLKHVIRNGVDV